jgi:hypothetical protein
MTKRIGVVDRAQLRKLAAGRYWGESEGRAALAAFAASGLTQVAFREATGIAPQRLKWWRHRLEVAGEVAKIEFVPVEVTPRTTSTAGDAAAMEIVIGEIRVRVGPGFDSAALQRLLAALGERAC